MFRISGIIAFQTKKSNLELDLRKETDINELQREIEKKNNHARGAAEKVSSALY